jgi:carbon-monoxide dehydrogenase large subunit
MARVKIGESPIRVEDVRFLTGAGRYVDDLPFEKLAHLFVLRSPHAHAYLQDIDTHEAKRQTGVLAVLTGVDQADAGINPIEPYARENFRDGKPFAYTPQLPLATDHVRYVGQPVAIVIAHTLAQARDAAELIDIEFAPLPAITTVEAALEQNAPSISDQVPDNVVLRWNVGSQSATDKLFSNTFHKTKLRITNHRVITNSMEPRMGVGYFNSNTTSYTLHVSSQSLHMARDCIAEALGADSDKVRVIAPDVGGGFGVKNIAYGEHVLLLWAARVTGCPVKWVNERSAGFISDHQARDHFADAELALDKNGKFLALRIKSWANLGAYLCGAAGRVCCDQYASLPGTVYEIPEIFLSIGAVATNTVPIGVTRGPGFAEAVNILERLIDRAAREMGFDRADLRRRNMRKETPFTSLTGTYVDSGQFSINLDVAMRSISGFEERCRQSESNGRLRGLGFAYHIKATGGAPEEKVELTFEGEILTLTTGTQSIGQGHETTFPQIISELLGVPTENIRYRHGDTGLISKGGGHGSSRATYMGGTAMFLAIEKIIAKGKPVAAKLLEAAEADITFADGNFTIAGTDRTVGIFTVAKFARETGVQSETGDVGLDTPQEFEREFMTFPNGCHVAEIEIDTDTGKVTVVRYSAVDDYGKIINPMVASGQIHGAIAQGIGQALLEHAVYDETSGQLLSGSFMDYAMPRAGDVPSFDVTFNGIDCTTNPLGVKGCGEAGAIAGFPAVGNAISDALSPFDVHGFNGPATPERVWRVIQNARSAKL